MSCRACGLVLVGFSFLLLPFPLVYPWFSLDSQENIRLYRLGDERKKSIDAYAPRFFGFFLVLIPPYLHYFVSVQHVIAPSFLFL